MKLTPALLIVVACLCFIGCVRRTITITSTPSGAMVHLNDQELGLTPVTTKFLFYGTYDLRLKKEGYKHYWKPQKAVAPWWEAPGPDLIAELIPNNKVELKWHINLESSDQDLPLPVPFLLTHHASQLRSLAERDNSENKVTDPESK